MNLQLVVGLLPAVIALATARWLPSHTRLLNQARDDLALAERLGRGAVSRELRRRAAEATTQGLVLRDSNDAGRNLAVFAAIGLFGAVGLPVYWSAVPASIEGWHGPVMLALWGVYVLFVLAAVVGWVWWFAKRPR